ncbi:MAG: 2-C-methyl-D-erythritol 4-phosphate cytidylyltransferase, partial [Micrococcaceae bacterium]|nr:2-C-methyl-D-erythritol 4-phosphate cytidylyltransferase [Micrococcaceae bacterium]MDN5888071.1 2-C-methyl-D-erythritol 4-phosphate cytidylyltransferase [Micrococcaceae bacterium]
MTATTSTGPRVGIILVAAGSGTRLGHGIPKALVEVAGTTLLEHALRAALTSRTAHEMVVVLPPGEERLLELCAEAARKAAIPLSTATGGSSRNDSVRAGLAELGDVDHVLVHDAARCLTPADVFVRVAAALAAGATAVVPGVAVSDTIKSIDPKAPATAGIPGAHRVTGTPDRSGLRAIQTPQGFDARALDAAHAGAATLGAAEAEAITDDARLMEATGSEVLVVPGAADAFKITTGLDLLLAEALLASRTPSTPSQE